MAFSADSATLSEATSSPSPLDQSLSGIFVLFSGERAKVTLLKEDALDMGAVFSLLWLLAELFEELVPGRDNSIAGFA